MYKKVILITGASRGLGFAYCNKFANAGYQVVGAVRQHENALRLNHQAKLMKQSLRFVKCDVTSDTDVLNLKQTILDHENRLDILINNAGILPDNETQGTFLDHSILNTEIEKFEIAINTNVLGALRITKAALPLLISSTDSDRKIINISSKAGQMATLEWGIPAYSMSKVALNALTKLVATEFSEQKIICVSFSPGWVKTDMGGPDASKDIEESSQEMLDLVNLIKIEHNGSFLRSGTSLAW